MIIGLYSCIIFTSGTDRSRSKKLLLMSESRLAAYYLRQLRQQPYRLSANYL